MWPRAFPATTSSSRGTPLAAIARPARARTALPAVRCVVGRTAPAQTWCVHRTAGSGTARMSWSAVCFVGAPHWQAPTVSKAAVYNTAVSKDARSNSLRVQSPRL